MINSFSFREINPGIERVRSSYSLPRHPHLQAYATIVLAGVLEEAGNIGRIRATAGDVLIHPELDSHANCKVRAGVSLLRLQWSDASGSGGLYRLKDVDVVARTAEKNVTEAGMLLRELLDGDRGVSPGISTDWPDELADTLAQVTPTAICHWAELHGLAPETVSRGFGMAYGTPPTIFRAELRTRAAWLSITRSAAPLRQIATDAGFSDQAHMTRWIRRTTGASPIAWRKRLTSSQQIEASKHR